MINVIGRTVVRVTVGIPTRNRGAVVVRAILSALCQTYSDIEVVVSDNCSTDDTVQRVEAIGDPRLVLLKQPRNLGMVGNFNACLSAATGALFLLLSDDDLLDPTAVERLVAPFHTPFEGLSPTAVGLSWGPCRIVNGEGAYLWNSLGGPVRESALDFILEMFNGNRGPRFCSIMLRTEDAVSMGGYNENRYGPLCDMGSWVNIALRYDQVVCMKEPVATYTMHPASETSQGVLQVWVGGAENINDDVAHWLRAREDVKGQKRLRTAGMNHISNAIVSILLQGVVRQGGVRNALRMMTQWWRYLMTPYVARRFFRDGWKLLRLQR